MIGYGLIIFGLILLAVVFGYLVDSQKKKPLSEDRLKFWLGQMAKPTGGRVRSSKAFKKTTARLPEDDYIEIEKLYTPELKAEYTERLTALRHEIGTRAIEVKLVHQKKMMNEQLTEKDIAVLIREKLPIDDELLATIHTKEEKNNENSLQIVTADDGVIAGLPIGAE